MKTNKPKTTREKNNSFDEYAKDAMKRNPSLKKVVELRERIREIVRSNIEIYDGFVGFGKMFDQLEKLVEEEKIIAEKKGKKHIYDKMINDLETKKYISLDGAVLWLERAEFELKNRRDIAEAKKALNFLKKHYYEKK